MKTVILTLSKTEYEIIKGKLYHKILKRQEFNKYLKKTDQVDAMIEQLRTKGKTYREISDFLNHSGFRTKQGKEFHPGSILNRLWYLKREE